MSNESYLVDGAKLKCICGSKEGCLSLTKKKKLDSLKKLDPFNKIDTSNVHTKKELNLTGIKKSPFTDNDNIHGIGKNKLEKRKNTGVAIKDLLIATKDDCDYDENIPSFGICSLTGKPCLPEVLGKWLCSHKDTKINGVNAITTNSGLLCGAGGLIVAASSGQEDIMKMLPLLYEEAKELYGTKVCLPFSKDPVNLCTGNYVSQVEDLAIRGQMSLSFTRTYNSLDTRVGVLGEGWIHNHEISLTETRESVEVSLGDGQVQTFIKKGGIYDDISGTKLKKNFDNFEYITRTGDIYTFDLQGLCIEKKDINNNVTSYDYINGMLSSISNTSGNLNIEYDLDDRLLSVSDHTDRVIYFKYEERKLVEVSNLLGGTKQYKYSEDTGKLIQEITPEGAAKVENEYDKSGRTVKQVFPDGGVVKYEYNDENGKTTLTEQNGNRTRYYKNKKNQHIRTGYRDGYIEQGYNESGQLTRMRDKNGDESYFQYDSQGRMERIINALGDETKIQYNWFDKPDLLQKPDGSIIKNEYDTKGNLTKTIDALGRTLQYIYNDSGIPKKIIHPDGSEMSIKFDSRNNIKEVTNPFGATIFYEYDDLNRVIQSIDGNGNTTDYQYDENNNLILVRNAEGYEKKYKYNSSGKIIEIVDFDGLSSTWEYDALKHPTKITDKEGNSTQVEYDLMWNVSKCMYPNDAQITYKYNKLNQLESIVNADKSVIRYEYDPNENKVKMIHPNDSATNYSYDAMNQLVRILTPDGNHTYMQYNSVGKMVRLTNPLGEAYHIEYDSAGQKIKEIAPSGRITQY